MLFRSWLVDHKGDFQLLVQKKLGKDIEVNFGSPRVLLVAQTFSKYDQYAINRMAENIELWGYSRYEDNVFELKLIASAQAEKATSTTKQITKVNYEEYSIEDHLKNKSEQIKELFSALREKIFALESDQKIEENPRKLYIAYKVGRSFAEVKLQRSDMKIWVGEGIDDHKGMIRDVSNIGHHGIGNSEITLKSFDELDYVVGLIKQSYLQSI